MKEKYITPEMDIILFECEDVITTSGVVANALNETMFLASSYIGEIDDSQWSNS